MRVVLAVVFVVLGAPVARAHHRQTPPIVEITPTGDAALPRLAPASRKAAAVIVDDTIAVVSPFQNPTTPTFSFKMGTNGSPTISANGRTVAWDTDADPLGNGAPGRQVIRATRFGMTQVAIDPTGTSENPALDLFGSYAAFESTADLAGTGNVGARQIFFRHPDGTGRLRSSRKGSGRVGIPRSA